MAETFKIRKGDEVVVNTGKDKGRKGSVLNVNRKDRRVLVQGVNMVKRHTRPTQGSAGGIIEKEASVALSNVSIVDPKTGEASRVGYKTLDDGRKVRFAKKSGEVIDL
ncbi:MAG: 50S ribosomal protein L24 [Alphaproteobacteria bacterium]|jgi:large subunit ribosomal protein L24|nr:50S ribosomal protein L24 [Alphaproteobacteria bacterium]MBT4083081.1 50S ribosomal protein L24 [Alphaproteobacteria bacterium]